MNLLGREVRPAVLGDAVNDARGAFGLVARAAWSRERSCSSKKVAPTRRPPEKRLVGGRISRDDWKAWRAR
ncbi:MAG: hypothetical protein IPQ09_24850, partial [Myxococcales bacterium]|nr:hypothetical protein [Myxococcales bacterium]